MIKTNLSYLLWYFLESTPKPQATRCIGILFYLALLIWILFFFTVYNSVQPAMAQHVWQSCRAQPPKSSVLLFPCQAIITAIRSGRLVNLNPGITLWHQAEEDVMYCVLAHRSCSETVTTECECCFEWPFLHACRVRVLTQCCHTASLWLVSSALLWRRCVTAYLLQL